MRVAMAAPVAATSSRGNGATARRWQALLTDLGHRVRIHGAEPIGPTDLLIALHARQSATSIQAFRHRHQGVPIVLAMTGTDLHHDLPDCPAARASVAAADRIVVLYEGAARHLEPAMRDKVVVILQSKAAATADSQRSAHRPPVAGFSACVLAHLRAVKDPLCAARAVARLPPTSSVRVVLAGAVIDADYHQQVQAAQRSTPAFEWVGELSPAAATTLLVQSQVMVISSMAEGGANVVSEAIVAGVPILASEIDGNVGLLGRPYQGYFPAGDDSALAALLTRASTDPAYLAELEASIRALQPRFTPANERAAWQHLLANLKKPT